MVKVHKPISSAPTTPVWRIPDHTETPYKCYRNHQCLPCWTSNPSAFTMIRYFVVSVFSMTALAATYRSQYATESNSSKNDPEKIAFMEQMRVEIFKRLGMKELPTYSEPLSQLPDHILQKWSEKEPEAPKKNLAELAILPENRKSELLFSRSKNYANIRWLVGEVLPSFYRLLSVWPPEFCKLPSKLRKFPPKFWKLSLNVLKLSFKFIQTTVNWFVLEGPFHHLVFVKQIKLLLLYPNGIFFLWAL